MAMAAPSQSSLYFSPFPHSFLVRFTPARLVQLPLSCLVYRENYTEPHGLRETPNSQCAKCTACKKSCPDINEENGYWKEVESRPKRFVYLAYPGLVFGFYFYYYLQSGTWEYYFSGVWTNELGLFRSAFLPGHSKGTAGLFFLPAMPRALAAILTLALCALVSFFLFSQLERLVGRWLRRRDPEAGKVRVRHVMFTVAAFTAFVTFYTFAGAPTLRLVPGLPRFFAIFVVLTATLSLARRMPRTQKTFAEESLARNIIKRWPWTEVKPPKDLREAFLIHTIRSNQSSEGYARLLAIYKDAVRESLLDGLVTRQAVNLMLLLRNQLQTKQQDHEKIMAALVEEERTRIDHLSKQMSAEKRLQLDTYVLALEGYLERVLEANGAPDDSFINELRAEFRVTKDEHAAVLSGLFGGEKGSPNLVLAFLESQGQSRKL